MPINKNTNEWGQLSMKDRADLIAIYSKHGYTSIDDIRKDYESNRSHFINSDANFVQRLRNNDTRSVKLEDGSEATHYMNLAEGDYQSTIYPSIQELDGTLVDRRDSWLGGYREASDNKDTVNVSKPFGEYYSSRYKKDFQNFFEKFTPQTKTVDDMNEEFIYDNRREKSNTFALGGEKKKLNGYQQVGERENDWYKLQDEYPNIYKKIQPNKPSRFSPKGMAYNIGVNAQDNAKVKFDNILDFAKNNDDYVPTIYAYVFGPDKVYHRFNGESTGFDYANYLNKAGYNNVNQYNGLFNKDNKYYINKNYRGLINEFANRKIHTYDKQNMENADDVNSYIHQFTFDKNGNPVISDSDVYDFYKQNSREFNPLYRLEGKLMEKIGTPYILRQDNIPIEFTNDIYPSEIDEHLDSIPDEEVARLTNSGYIEPATITEKRKPRIYTGRGNKFEDGGQIYSGGNIKPSQVSATLSRAQWDKLYKEGKVNLKDIPRKYQPWIEGNNSKFKQNITNSMDEFGRKYVAPAIIGATGAYGASQLLPYIAPGTAGGTMFAKTVIPMLGGEVLNGINRQLTGYNTVGENVRGTIQKHTGFNGFDNNGIISDFGNSLYTLATESMNPAYFLPYEKMANSAYNQFRNVGKATKSAISDYRLLKNAKSNGVATKEIPINENNFYRYGNDSMIDDANVSGVIRANPNSYNMADGRPKKWAGASFSKGTLYNDRLKSGDVVIEGFNSPDIQWVKKPIHFEMGDFINGVDNDFLTQSAVVGDEVMPLYFGNVNTAPSKYFNYYKKGDGLFSKKYWFKKDFENPLSFAELIEQKNTPIFSSSTTPFDKRFKGDYGELKLIRNLNGLPKEINSNMVYASNPESALANFTYDLPFRTHKNYSKIPGLEYMIVDPAAYAGKYPLSIKPMDTIFENENTGIAKKYIQILSGNRELLKEAQNNGYRVITSPKLIDLYNNINEEALKSTSSKIGNINIGKNQFGNQESTRLYQDEVDRLFSSVIGRPSLDDVKYLEKATNLNAGVESANLGIKRATDYNGYIDSMLNQKRSKNYIDFKYADDTKVNNGFNMVAKKQYIPTNFYNSIFYNPTPTIELDILKKYGISPHPKKYDVFNERFNAYINGLNPIEYDVISNDIGSNAIVKNKFKYGGDNQDIKNDKGIITEYGDTLYSPAYYKHIGTEHDITKNHKRFIEDPQEFKDVVDYFNFTENPDVMEYFKSYAQSTGYDRIRNNQDLWWKKRHPYLKYIDFNNHLEAIDLLRKNILKSQPVVIMHDGSSLDTFYSHDSENAYISNKLGRIDNAFNPTFAAGHEAAHHYNSSASFGGPSLAIGDAQREALEQNTNTNLSESEISNKHDSELDEKHSDVWGLKYLLYKEGIYDSRGNKDATAEDIKKLREKYPHLRPLQQMDDEKAAWMINHVAYNNTESKTVKGNSYV